MTRTPQPPDGTVWSRLTTGLFAGTAGVALALGFATVVGVGGYYYFRTTSNAASLEQRNLRELARMARTIEARIDSFQSVAEVLAAETNGLSAETAYFERILGPDANPQKEILDFARSRALGYRGVVEADWVPHMPDGTPDAVSASNRGGMAPRAASPLESCRTSEATGSGVSFIPKTRRNTAFICSENLGLEIDLAKLLVPVIGSVGGRHDGVGPPEFFDQVFVADADGEVFLSAGSSGIRMRSVRTGEKDSLQGLARLLEGSVGQQNGAGNVDEVAPDDSSGTVATSEVRSEEIGGVAYRLFLQPVRINLETAHEQDADWLLGGLVTSGDFSSESLALDSTELLVLLMALLLAVFASPFLRLWKAGRRERIDIRDVLATSFSLIVGGGVVALCLVEAAFYPGIRLDVDERMTKLTRDLQRNLHTEIGDALAELASLTDRFEEEMDSLPDEPREELRRALLTPNSEDHYAALLTAARRFPKAVTGRRDRHGFQDRLRPFIRHQLLSELTSRAETDKTRRRAIEKTGTPDSGAETLYPFAFYPYFESVALITPEGRQFAKWAAGEPTPLVNVADREYFQRIKDHRFWQWPTGHDDPAPPSRGSCEAGRFFLDVVRSKTTGEASTEIAIPYCARWGDTGFNGFDTGVAVLSTKLASVTDAPLPPGAGFAVIRSDGRTLLHSQEERNLEEDFFEETNFDARLRSAVGVRSGLDPAPRDGAPLPVPFNADYMGREMRLFVAPLSHTPLSIVVFFDRTQLRTLNLEIVLLALMLLVTYYLMIAAVIVVLRFVAPPTRMRWAWPQRANPRKYWAVLVIQAVFAVLLGGLLVRGSYWNPGPQWATVYLVPVQALALTLYVLLEPGRRRTSAFWLATGAAIILTALNVAFATLGLVLWSVAAYGVSLLIATAAATVTDEALHAASVAVAPDGSPIWRRWSLLHERSTLAIREAGRPFEKCSYTSLYVAATALTLLVLGALPAISFFQVVQHSHLELFVKHSQVKLAESLFERRERLNQRYVPLSALSEQTAGNRYLRARDDRLTFRWPLDRVLGTSFVCWSTEAPTAGSGAPAQGEHFLCAGRAENGGAHRSDDDVTVPGTGTYTHVRFTSDPDATRTTASRSFVQNLRYLPFFNEVSVATRNLLAHETADDGWAWSLGDVSAVREDPGARVETVGASTGPSGEGDGPGAPARRRRAAPSERVAATRAEWPPDWLLLADGPAFQQASARTVASAPTRAQTTRTQDGPTDQRESPLPDGAASYRLLTPALRGSLLPSTPESWLAWIFFTSLSSVAFVLLVQFQSRRVFLLDFDVSEPEDLASLAKTELVRSLYLVCPAWCERAPLESGAAHVEFVPPEDLLVRHAAAPARSTLGLDLRRGGVTTPWARERLLGSLERALQEGRTVVVMAARPPHPAVFDPLLTDGQDEAGSPDDRSQILTRRWMHVLASFNTVFVRERHQSEHALHNRKCFLEDPATFLGGPLGFLGKRDYRRALVAAQVSALRPKNSTALKTALRERRGVLATLVSECRHTRPMQQIGLSLAAQPLDDDLDEAKLIERIRLAADGYYRAIWADLSQDEQLLVAQLAQGAVNSHDARGTVSLLLKQGLLVRDDDHPRLDPMNRSFGRFVLETVDPKTVDTWEESGERSAWQQLRIPLLLGTLALVVFLFTTQRQLFNSTLAFLSAVTVGAPALFRMLTMVGGGTRVDPGSG